MAKILSDNLLIQDSIGKGKGIFAAKNIKDGQKIITEAPIIMGPKQTSPFVCIDCFDYINDQTVSPCRKCGLPLCPDCCKMGLPKFHGLECKLFETSEKYKSDHVTTYEQAKAIYMYLTPLRLLLKGEENPDLLKLDTKLKERADTLIFFFTVAHVVKPLHKVLGLKDRFSELKIQEACGILDTNCYEIKWDRGIARGLFQNIAFINHDCVPNCRKYFDAHRNMHVITAENVDSGQELSLSYINPLLSTPMRQAILHQTKCFKCICPRCRDPLELGSGLSGLKCKNKSIDCNGIATQENPLDSDSDLVCNQCQQVITNETAKMMQDFVMNSISVTNGPRETLDTLNNMERFLPQSNHIMVDLKMKLIDQVLENEALRQDYEDLAISFCFQLLELAKLIAPGLSKLRGVLSMKYHQLTEKGPNPLVLSKDFIDSMFTEDQSVLLLD